MNHHSSEHHFPAVSRRGFLAAGGAGVVGMPLRKSLSMQAASGGSVIQIVLSGGASQLDTFDPKPHAPREVRGPLHSIATSLPGVRFSECLPQLAERAHHLVVLRSLFHQAAPIHATGLQLLLTGGLVRKQVRPPHIGFLVRQLLPERRHVPAVVELGGSLQATGTAASTGDSAGSLLPSEPETKLPTLDAIPPANSAALDYGQVHRRIREAYGATSFGSLFWTAARLAEMGVRYIPVNTFDRLEGAMTWDAHGCPQTGPATVFDYGNTIGPQFDRALAALIDDLQRSGLWKQTLIVVSGEMGRTPRMNAAGGRDHWTQAWSGLLAGGMLQSGQVIGETDEHGESILEAPLELQQLPALVLESLGIPSGTQLETPDGHLLATPAAAPLFA